MNQLAETEDVFAELFPKTHRAINEGIDSGLHRGCQICVSRGGQTLANLGLGEAAADVPMAADTINLWRSAGKPMTAAAVLRLMEDCLVSLDDPVARHIPQFNDDSITIFDLLVHTSGLPNTEVGWPNVSWEEVIDSVCEFKRDPAIQAGYSYFANWFLLGEILLSCDADAFSFGRKMQSDIFGPLEMSDTWNGMLPAEWEENQHRIAEVETITLSGRRRAEPLHQQEHCIAASPGSNLRSTAQDVVRFYESLESGDFFSRSDTLPLMTHSHREGLTDETFKAEVRMGLGVILTPKGMGVPYDFGDFCSSRTYGHGGAQCSMAFCDPQHELIVAWVVNGFPGEPKHQQRNRAINSAIYGDLT